MKICIDAGHYKGYNSGAVKGYYEGDVVWDLSNLQKKYLEEYEGVTVVLTRSDITKDLALSTRGSKAKGCDLFLSNHTNACGTESVDRAVVIYAFDNKNNAKDLAGKLASIINTTMGVKQNYQLMQKANSTGKDEYYGVLRGARSVGCPRYYILEHGFHTNKYCCNWLMNRSNLEKLAKAEVEAIAKYYGLKKKGTTSNTSTTWKNGSYEGKKARVTADVLNVRKGRGTDFAILGKLKKGDIVNLSYCLDKWVSIPYVGGTNGMGYIHTDYLTII